MISSDSLCMGCMRNIGAEKKCPHCGFMQDYPQPEPYLPIRTCLGNRYLVGKLLDCDGEGATYIGWDLKNRTAVDIREFIPDKFATRFQGNPGLQVMMGSESTFLELKGNFIELWTRLARLNGLSALIQVTDIIEEFGTAYAVYEHIDGITLGDFLLRSKTGNMTWDKAKQLLMPSITTIGTLHQNGIIHRGISPSTLIIGEDGKIRITGFATSDLRTMGSRINPRIYDGYAAVEQYGREFRQGPWTDVYAFGAVIYRTLIGMDPLSARERMNDDRLAVPGKFREQIPGQVINCLVDTLQLLPKERVNNIEAVRAALLNTAPVAAAPVAPVQAPQQNYAKKHEDDEYEKPKKKQKSSASIVLKTTLIVILVCAVIGGIVLMIMNGDDWFGDDEETTVSSSTEAAEGYINIPNLVGQNSQRAQATCKSDGLQVKVVQTETTDSTMVGYVVSQDPEYSPNSSIKKGTLITIYVGVAPAEFKFPDVVGMNCDRAKEQLEELGLVVEIAYIDSDNFGKGANNVQYASKMAGANVHKGDKVTLSVYVPAQEETQPTTEADTETNLTRAPEETTESTTVVVSDPTMIQEYD